MELIKDFFRNEAGPSVATIGFFDGVHLGHRHLIQQVQKAAAERSLSSMVVTFPDHPRQVVQTDFQPRFLSTFDEKCRLLAATGIDCCAVLPFTSELAALSAREFMSEILYRQWQVKVLVIGYDHRFGHNRSEGFEDYLRYGADIGMEVLQADVCRVGEVNASSSVVRTLLAEGEVSLAARCLGYSYVLEGTVVGGQQIGRTLGFPTANLQVNDALKLVPADGVYAVRVRLGDDIYKGMLNIGCRPTIDEDTRRTIEVHLFHFVGDLYGRQLSIEFVRRIRGEQKFRNREALTRQLQLDAEACQSVLD